MVVVGSVGADGRVWASLLVGEPGFVRALDEQTLRIDATPFPGDPLAEALQGAGTQVGVIAIDLATRRRLRLNGEAEMRPDGIHVRTRQVYANCPKYIQAPEPETGGAEPGLQDGYALRSPGLTDEQRRLVSDADTFFIASTHPEGGADASHRGGNPGFVRFLGENALEFPDYSGNTMFNTLGNIAANPSAGLLFLDFEGGGTLQLTGEARIVWDAGRAARFAGAERVVEFRVQEAVESRGAVPLRWRFEDYHHSTPPRVPEGRECEQYNSGPAGLGQRGQTERLVLPGQERLGGVLKMPFEVTLRIDEIELGGDGKLRVVAQTS